MHYQRQFVFLFNLEILNELFWNLFFLMLIATCSQSYKSVISYFSMKTNKSCRYCRLVLCFLIKKYLKEWWTHQRIYKIFIRSVFKIWVWFCEIIKKNWPIDCFMNFLFDTKIFHKEILLKFDTKPDQDLSCLGEIQKSICQLNNKNQKFN